MNKHKWFNKTDSTYVPFSTDEYKFYNIISLENRFYDSNTYNKHYIDDGCLCHRCIKERKFIVSNLDKQINKSIYIRHAYDNTCNNNIFLKLFYLYIFCNYLYLNLKLQNHFD